MTVVAVDCHAHVLSGILPITSDRHKPPERDYTVEELLALFDAHGISHGLLTAPSYYLSDNRLLLNALAKGVGRLRGTVILEPDTPAAVIADLAEQGVCGIRLNWWRKKALPDIRQYVDLISKVRDAGWHLELFLDGLHMTEVLPVIESTGVKLVLDHFGCPEPIAGVESDGFREVLRMVDAGRTWVKLSAPYRLGGGDAHAYARCLLDVGGPRRLVWATDWPWGGFEEGMTYSLCMQWLEQWVPDESDRRVILADTPRDLFGF